MAIFNNTTELANTAKVNSASPWETWQIYITDAKNKFLLPYLGFDMLDELEKEILSIEYEKLKPYVQRCLGPFAVGMATDEMSIRTGDGGHTVEKTGTVTAASDTKISKAQESLYQRGWSNLEILLDYLENHANEYSNWKNSKYYKNRSTKYFDGSSTFQDKGMIDIEYSRLQFEKLRTLIIGIENTEVSPMLSVTLENEILSSTEVKYNALKDAVRAYIGAKVAELHTSQKTRVQRSKNNNLEYKGMVRPLYVDDVNDMQNYYTSQVNYWKGKIVDMLPNYGIDTSGMKMDWDNKGKHLFSTIS